MPQPSRQSARWPATISMAKRAQQLRAQGKSYKEIGVTLGRSVKTIGRYMRMVEEPSRAEESYAPAVAEGISS